MRSDQATRHGGPSFNEVGSYQLVYAIRCSCWHGRTWDYRLSI
ncbi:hypothetical protein AB6U14_21795 [Klebsiella pneumoniae]